MFSKHGSSNYRGKSRFPFVPGEQRAPSPLNNSVPSRQLVKFVRRDPAYLVPLVNIPIDGEHRWKLCAEFEISRRCARETLFRPLVLVSTTGFRSAEWNASASSFRLKTSDLGRFDRGRGKFRNRREIDLKGMTNVEEYLYL